MQTVPVTGRFVFQLRCNQALPDITNVGGIFLLHAPHVVTNSQNSFFHKAACCGVCEPQLSHMHVNAAVFLAVYAGDAAHLQCRSSQ